MKRILAIALFAAACRETVQPAPKISNYFSEGSPWRTTDVLLMGADGKPCKITFGMANTPMLSTLFGGTTCPYESRAGVIHNWKGWPADGPNVTPKEKP